MKKIKISELARKEALEVPTYVVPPVSGAEVKLNQNESPYDVPGEVRALVERELAGLEFNRYPDSTNEELRVELADYVKCGPENVVAGNGADELIYYIGLAFLKKGEKAVAPAPSFAMYEIISRLMGCKSKVVRLAEDFSLPDEFVKQAKDACAVFVCSPNNPTGNSTKNERIREIAEKAKGIVVVDEAYSEFSPYSCMPLVKEFENVIVLKTFSKAFSAAGLRVGYAVACEEAASLLNRVRQPWNISTFSQKAGVVLLRNKEIFRKNVERIVKERERVTKEISKIGGAQVYPSDANFYLLKTPLPGKTLFTKLWERSVLVRDVSSQPMLEKCVRANVGTPEENDALVEALKAIAAGMGQMEW